MAHLISICRFVKNFPENKKEIDQGIIPTLYYLSSEVSKLGVNQYIICSGQPKIDYIEEMKIYRVKSPYHYHGYKAFKTIVQQDSIELVQIHNTDFFAYSLLKEKFKVPLIVYLHENPETAFYYTAPSVTQDSTGFLRTIMWYKIFTPIRMRLVLNRADAIITVSRNLAESIIKSYNVPSQKMHVIHNGVDTTVFRPLRNQGFELKRQLGIEDRKVILYVGNLSNRKGLTYLLEAAVTILKKIKDACFLIIGGSPKWLGTDVYEEELLTSIKAKGIEDSFLLLGTKPYLELPQYYSAADIFVLPSLYEPFGKVVIEAMACQTPVIASRVGGIPEIVEEGVTGLLVNPGNSKELAHKILTLIQDTSSLSSMGRQGRNAVKNKFSWKKAAEKNLSLYRNIVNK
jgi:glycosyltransferase involved in cell wall biosynthesis